MATNNNDKNYGDVQVEKRSSEWDMLLQSTLDVASSVAALQRCSVDNAPTTLSPVALDISKLFVGGPVALHLRDQNPCYIISNRFEKKAVGKGNLKAQYEVDERNIEVTFSQLNFKVKKRIDLSAEEMKIFVREISAKDYSDQQCLVLFILSHGGEGGTIRGVDWNIIEVDSIIDKLQDIESLNGKPKLVFLQVCRGSKDMEIVKVPQNTHRAAGSVVQKAKKADTFVYYSTMKGHMAFASSLYGSFFIFGLCEVMKEFYIKTTSPKYHLGDVVIRVNDFLSTYIREFERVKGQKAKEHVQVSEACSSLTKNLYFYPKETQK